MTKKTKIREGYKEVKIWLDPKYSEKLDKVRKNIKRCTWCTNIILTEIDKKLA